MRLTPVFDLDGTLVDSRPGILACFRHTFDVLGVDGPADAVLTASIGQPFRQAMANLLKTTEPDAIERAVSIYRQRYSTVGLYEASVYDGVAELLATVAAETTYVATSKAVVFAERVLTHFDLAKHFRGIYGPDLHGRPAGKIELIRQLLRREPIAGRAMMIGDRAEDITAGRANGISAVGVLWGYGAERELVEAGAAAVCHTPHDLASYLAMAARQPGKSG